MADGALGEQQGPRSKEPWREMIGSPVPLFPPLCHSTPALQRLLEQEDKEVKEK